MRKIVMRRIMTICLVVATAGPSSGLQLAQAQDSATRAEQAEKPVHAYRLDFALNELEGEKKLNTRHYSINLVSGDRQEVKIGTRVPVATASFPTSASSGTTVSPAINTQFQYLDVGTHIWCTLKEHSDALELQAGGDISNIDSGPSLETNGLSAPVVRQIKIVGGTIVVPGKPIVIGSADDPTSNRQFQLEVTVTKLR